jgi:hypothetical protein
MEKDRIFKLRNTLHYVGLCGAVAFFRGIVQRIQRPVLKKLNCSSKFELSWVVQIL